MLDSWYEVFVLVWSIFTNFRLGINVKHLHFGLVCPKEIVPEVLWFVQVQLYNPKSCCYVVFREMGISSGNPCKQVLFVTVMNFNIKDAEAFRV